MVEVDRERWLKIPFTGCDGMPKTGQTWLRTGVLAATIYIPPNTDKALELLTDALRSKSQPAERQLTVAKSLPSVEELAARASKASTASSTARAGTAGR
jgi:ribose transport system substrate-binding protein